MDPRWRLRLLAPRRRRGLCVAGPAPLERGGTIILCAVAGAVGRQRAIFTKERWWRVGAAEGAVLTLLGAVRRLASSRWGRSDSTLAPQATAEARRGSRGLHWGGLCTLVAALEGSRDGLAMGGGVTLALRTLYISFVILHTKYTVSRAL